MFHNIPDEMKRFNQWIVWKYDERQGGKPTKVPYCPQTGGLASVSEANTWSTFDFACNAFYKGGFSGIGFVLCEHDPYTFIDLDNPFELDENGHQKYSNPQEILERQIKIHDAFNSYSEKSPSGYGLHIICNGNAPSGKRRDAVELYSTARYMTMTGNVYNQAPIQPRQEYISLLWAEMAGNSAKEITYQGEAEERYTDEEVIKMGSEASNGVKFMALGSGNWTEYYDSQSEADYALINMLSFYSQNKTQIKRLFRSSALGQRAKAKREDYVSWMINKSFDRMMPPVDLTGLKQQMQEMLRQKHFLESIPQAKPENNRPKLPNPYTFPGGLVGQIAEFIYAQSIYPVKEISLIAALALMSGICGKSHNVSGTGLNNYFVLLAKTGRGKEAMAKGIDKIINKVKINVPQAVEFIGPAEFASPQALVKHLQAAPCFMSVLTEFAMLLKQLTAPTANANMAGLRRMFLNLYNKSGNGQSLGGIVYSDRDKNTHTLNAPCFSFLGECTPEKYYRLLDEDLISEGLLPRFTTFEYLGEREAANKHHNSVKPSPDLIQTVSTYISAAMMLKNNGQAVNVIFDREANEIFNNYNDTICNANINKSDLNGVSAELWTRSHVKAMKLAALVAVGNHLHFPVITKEIAEWAIAIINYDNDNIIGKFESGEISTHNGDILQVKEATRICQEYVVSDWDELANYKALKRDMHRMNVIPYRYLIQRLSPLAPFRCDKMGSTNAVKKTIATLVDSGDIQELPVGQIEKEYETRQRCFVVKKI